MVDKIRLDNSIFCFSLFLSVDVYFPSQDVRHQHAQQTFSKLEEGRKFKKNMQKL